MYDYIVKTNRDADAWYYNLDNNIIDSYQITHTLKCDGCDGTADERISHNYAFYKQYDADGKPQLQRGTRIGDGRFAKIVYKDGKTTIS